MLNNLTFSMAGSGNWRFFFPDESAYNLYKRLYPGGLDAAMLSPEERVRAQRWADSSFVKREDKHIRPQIPVMTQTDHSLFEGWFQNASHDAGRVLSALSDNYYALAERLSDNTVPVEHILTVLICGHTLDVGTLRELEEGIMGRPPERAGSGSYFIWGTEISSFSPYHFGVNTMGIDQFSLQCIWGRELKRIARGRKSLSIPVFDRKATEEVNALCRPASKKLAEAFTAGANDLAPLISQASFSGCSRGDVLCMIFHIGYEKMAKTLIEMNLLPNFPEEVDDSWGIWIHWQN